MIDSPQRHRVHRDIKFIALPRDTGKAIPSIASRDGIKDYIALKTEFFCRIVLPQAGLNKTKIYSVLSVPLW